MPPRDDMAIAKARIAKEIEQQTGSLDLSGLQIDGLPRELSQLTSLRQLNCGGAPPLSDLSPVADLTALQRLYCFGTEVSDLSPLSNLTALQQLVCSGTRVTDLSPLSSLTALKQLAFGRTEVSDLSRCPA